MERIEMKGYTVNQVAQILKTNPETVRRWIRNGKLQATQNSKKEGNIISEQALISFLELRPKYAAIAKNIASALPVIAVSAAPSAVLLPVFVGSITATLITSLSLPNSAIKIVTSEYIRNYLKNRIKKLQEEINNKNQRITQLQEEVSKSEQELRGLISVLENGDLEEMAASINLRRKGK